MVSPTRLLAYSLSATCGIICGTLLFLATLDRVDVQFDKEIHLKITVTP